MYAPCTRTCVRDGVTETPLCRTVKLYNGVKVPIIGFGTSNIPACVAVRCIKDAIDSGLRHIDCAPIFCNQEEVGEAIKEKIDEGFIKREQLYISSKLWDSRHDPKFVRRTLEETLKQLQLDYLDNYIMHSPMGFRESLDFYPRNTRGEILYSDVDYVDTWHAMEALVDQGLVRSIGLANFNADQIERIIKMARIQPANIQVESHPYLTQMKLMDLCCKHNMVFMAYNTTGTIPNNDPVISLTKHPKILCLSKKYGKSPALILIRYQIQRGNVVLTKTTMKLHMVQNQSIEDFHLSREDLEQLDLMNYNVRKHKLDYATGHPHHPFENDCF